MGRVRAVGAATEVGDASRDAKMMYRERGSVPSSATSAFARSVRFIAARGISGTDVTHIHGFHLQIGCWLDSPRLAIDLLHSKIPGESADGSINVDGFRLNGE